MKSMAAILAFAVTAALAAPARAQDGREELKRKILSEIEKKLDAEMKRILEEVSKLIDEEFAKAKGRKPAPAPSAGGAYLGIELDPEQPDADDFKAWNVEGGVRIIPREGAPAAQAGLKDGDVIIEVEGAKIKEWPDLPASLKTRKPGDKVKVKVLRGKETREITVTLGVRTEAPPAPAPAPADPGPKPEAAKPGRLGISAGAATGKGMAIESVSKDTPAALAGVKDGDILVKLDDTPIWKEADLEAFMKKAKAGQKVEITILRGTEEKKFSVVLAER